MPRSIHRRVPSLEITTLRVLGLLALALGLPGSELEAQRSALDALQTRAEATDYVETSRYDDIVPFLETVTAASYRTHLTTMGYTMEGRAIPMLVIGDVPDASPEAVRESGKLRVYVQGDIHGGEVPGKEALLMLAREIAQGRHDTWLEDLVLLVVPVYNADGNERVALTNRPRQHGPLGGMGQRPNVQGFDLNRDHMKLDSPEARSLVGMMSAYDPHLAVDLHTTNGTTHAYHVTYSPPLHPGTHDAIVDLLREEMLPSITESIRRDHGAEYYYYGNRSQRGGEVGWYTFDHRPRFNNNYVGLRNRLAILSEAYAYLTFEDRVDATKWFVEDILDYSAAHADELAAAVEAADGHSVVGETLPTRAVPAPSEELVPILMGDVARERHPWTGETILRRLDVERVEMMREYGTFEASDTEVAPRSYLVTPDLTVVLERLEAHGIPTTALGAEETRPVEIFALDSASTSPRPFQGHNERELFGRWEPARRTLPAGTAVVDVSGPLGRLAFYLLEPRSDDGLANWGLLDREIEGADEYPILRVPAGG